jgi:hypothetical protein
MTVRYATSDVIVAATNQKELGSSHRELYPVQEESKQPAEFPEKAEEWWKRSYCRPGNKTNTRTADNQSACLARYLRDDCPVRQKMYHPPIILN